MEEYTEVRWHGRAQQGIVTAAKVFAEAALAGGNNIQAFPDYGPERMGAPVASYNRISKKPLTVHCAVVNPRVIVVVDATLIGSVDILEGVPDNGVVIINTHKSFADIKKKIDTGKRELYIVDATKIALETIGKPFPNTPMMGALAKATNLVKLEDLLEETKKVMGRKLAKEILEGNLKAIERGYKEVKKQ
ncbi:MAG TPA: 2-oxoacid:acceptor oxidoreductase family protein [Nitrospinota bacterium]|nr:2-oxoacid:acceptor oxidoreductase family protein [Nitrospinota bacterium]